MHTTQGSNSEKRVDNICPPKYHDTGKCSIKPAKRSCQRSDVAHFWNPVQKGCMKHWSLITFSWNFECNTLFFWLFKLLLYFNPRPQSLLGRVETFFSVQGRGKQSKKEKAGGRIIFLHKCLHVQVILVELLTHFKRRFGESRNAPEFQLCQLCSCVT